MGLIGLDIPTSIVEAAIWTGKVKGVNPVSVLLVAKPESAKSQILLQFRDTPTLKYFTDITSKPLLSMKADIEARRIRHIVLQDLNVLGSHKTWVTDRLFAVLACFMEEGATTFADAAQIVELHGLPKIGLLAAITPAQFRDKRSRWSRLGFVTRFMSVHFDYTQETVNRVHESIRTDSGLPERKKLALPEQETDVMLPESYASLIEYESRTIAEWYGQYGFRFHRQLRALAKGLALSKGELTVSEETVSQLLTWLPFFDYRKPIRL